MIAYTEYRYSITFELIVWENIMYFVKQRKYFELSWLNKQQKPFDLKVSIFV